MTQSIPRAAARHHTVPPGTPGLLRSINDRSALRLLLERGPLTRASIGELTGLSKPTSSQVIARLERAGLVREAGSATGGRGPNAQLYAAVLDRVVGVAIELRPHQVVSTVVDAAGSARPVAVRELPRQARQRSIGHDVTLALTAACDEGGVDIARVGTFTIALQGAVDPRSDDLSFTGPIPGWPRRGLRAALRQHTDLPFRFDNDVNLAAVAERDARGGSAASFVLLWMGEGLGLGVYLAGALQRGASGGAGEIGYLRVPAAYDTGGATGTQFQQLVGGPAVARLAREHGLHGRSHSDVIAAISSHPARGDVIAALAPRVAATVIPVLAVLDPPLVVLGGPTGAAGGEQLADAVRATIRHTSPWAPTVAPTAVPDLPVLRGARSVVAGDVTDLLLESVS